MKKYLKKFNSAVEADNYHIVDIPFITSVDESPVQNLVCNETGKKLVNISGIVQVQSVGPEMVDLGLSVKWAKYNVGASSIEEYGGYFSWAETDEKSDYSWNTYKYGSDWNKLTKYCPSDKTDHWDGEGSPDNKLVLDNVDDVTTAVYGSDYRMPTKAEIEELIALPNKWININGVNGRVFCKVNEPGAIKGDFSIMEQGLYLYDKNHQNPDSEYGSYNIYDDFDPIGLEYQTKDEVNAKLTTYYTENYGYTGTVNVDTMLFKDEEHTIPAVAGTDYTFGSFPTFNPSSMLFIPAAGFFDGTSHNDAGSNCYLWSSSLNSGSPDIAWSLDVCSDGVNLYDNYRCRGFSVRAVTI